MTNYRAGVRAERRTQECLEAAGYTTMRTAGSHGAFDVIGVSATDIVLVQVKRGSKRPSEADVRALRELSVPPNVRTLVHYWAVGAREPLVM